MRLYRVCRSVYADEPFDGLGATFRAGRWHSKGARMAYASLEATTATLEVYMSVEREAFDVEWTQVVADIPDELVAELEPDAWPDGWNGLPHPVSTQRIGMGWLERASSLALRVPSTVQRPPPWNVLVNPLHPDASRIRIASRSALQLDPRLLSRLP